MSSTRVVARNVIWNSAGTLVHMLTGFVVAPFLVNRLGETHYGLWILIASLTGYFAALDLGVSGSLGRNLAFHLARKDIQGVRGIFSTALAILTGVAFLGLLATIGVLLVFFHLFEVPPDQVDAVRLALLLVGFNFSLSFILGAFDGTLWALQRFDLQNALDIPTVIVRAGFTFFCIGQGGGLVDLAVITLGTTVVNGLLKMVLSFYLESSFRFSIAAIRWDWAKSLYDYGIWYFLLSLAKNIQPQIGPTVIGNQLGAGLVTRFRIAAQLAGYGSTFMNTATQVLTPVATALHAENKHQQQQRLFVEGGKVCLLLTLYLFGLFYFLGQPLISLWMGPRFADACWILLVVLALGEILPMSQWISYGLFLGMNRHRWIAIYGLVEIVAGLVLALALVNPFGLMGVCLALALPATLCRGVVRLVYGCCLVNLPVAAYLKQAFVPGLLLSLPHLALLGLLTWNPPTNWLTFLATGSLSGAIFLTFLVGWLIGGERWRKKLKKSETPIANLSLPLSQDRVFNEKDEGDVLHVHA
jgi:O-antigen/teichoic acid export membrane protein